MAVLDARKVIARVRESSARGERGEILQALADGVRDSGKPYTSVYIYMLHGGELRLEAFSGRATEHRVISVGHGVCGTAVSQGKDQNVGDVSARSNYIACNAFTRSELVVLMRNKAGEIIGQIDVDSDQLNPFTGDEESALREVAHGRSKCSEPDGIKAYNQMKQQGLRPTNSVVIAALKECAKSKSLQDGKAIHADITQYISDIYVANTLLSMYMKCGSLPDGWRLFKTMPFRTRVSWNTIILGHAEYGQGEQALELFFGMHREGCVPDRVTFLAALKACTSFENIRTCLERLRDVHFRAAKAGLGSDNFVSNALVTSYTKCGSLAEAREVFDKMEMRDVVSWNAMILGYAQQGEPETSLQMFGVMQEEGCLPDRVTYLAALKACCALAEKRREESLRQGREVHAKLVKAGHELDVALANTLVAMYAKCDSLTEARQVFDRIHSPTVVSWNALIHGHAEQGDGRTALELFGRMKCHPDKVTFLAALKACSCLGPKLNSRQELLERVRAIQQQAWSTGLEKDVLVSNALITAYASCGSMRESQTVFEKMDLPTLVSWNSLILGYVNCGEFMQALDLFDGMQEPDSVTFLAALKACIGLAEREPGREVEGKLVKFTSLARGRKIHTQASRLKIEDQDILVANTMVAMYATCGCMVDARRVFDRIQTPNVVSWTALINGHAEQGEGEKALECFQRMRELAGISPDRVCYMAALKACSSLASLERGRKIHAEIREANLQKDVLVANSLVDFYGKCGSMEEAEEVFRSLGWGRDIVSWNSLIAGYSHQGDSGRVLELFERMQRERLKPDGITFVSVLSVCSHAGLVETGKECFEIMSSVYGVNPRMEHFNCMVDLLGRTNHLEDAAAMITTMPFRANVRIWMTLLDSCCKWKNLSIGKMAFEAVLEMDKNNPAAYCLMANIYDSLNVEKNM